MTEETIALSKQELDRLAVIRAVLEKRLWQYEAAEQLGLGERQLRRLVRSYRARGEAGLVSGRRGKVPSNRFSAALRQRVLALVHAYYSDFGPTLLSEQLAVRHGIVVSRETLRKWLQAEGLWHSRPRKVPRVHPSRPPRERLGELVQIDGSPHAWFEERGPRCTLLVFVDDATKQLLALRFVPAETTQAYMETLGQYLHEHGRPVALYSDRHSIFANNRQPAEGEPTQFTRALLTLDIAPIHAHTPQAKGRVERVNKTLQDRLVKELRLEGINDMATANAWLPQFMAQYNARFGVPPQDPVNAHRKVLHDPAELAQVLSLHHTRRLSKNLTCQFKNRLYQVVAKGPCYTMRQAAIQVSEAFTGEVTLLYRGRCLPYRVLAKGEAPIPHTDEKTLPHRVDEAKAKQAARPKWKPPVDHPWRRPLKPERAA